MTSQIFVVDDQLVLTHHGVKGMKWGVRKRREASGNMQINRGDSKATQRVKADYNRMSNREFKSKYYASKSRYAKRVAKNSDPYMARKKSGKKPMSKVKASAIGLGVAVGAASLATGAAYLSSRNGSSAAKTTITFAQRATQATSGKSAIRKTDMSKTLSTVVKASGSTSKPSMSTREALSSVSKASEALKNKNHVWDF